MHGLPGEVGETGLYRDTGSKGTVGGKIVDINKIKKNFMMLFQYVYSTLAWNLVGWLVEKRFFFSYFCLRRFMFIEPKKR